MDFLVPQLVKISLAEQFIEFSFVRHARASVTVKPIGKYIPILKVKAKRTLTIKPNHYQTVPFHTNGPLPIQYDFEFEAEQKPFVEGANIYNATIRPTTSHVIVRNDADSPVTIPKNARLGNLRPAAIEGMF